MSLRECPFCGSHPEIKSFRFERKVSVSAILCHCGASIILMDEEAKGAWQKREKTDFLLSAVLPVLKVFIMLCASHGVNADQEIALVLQIMKQLSGREEK